MSFDARQAERKRILERAMLLFQALAFAYLAMHFAVVWLVFKASGIWAALLTLITLGFGDLYWAYQWAHGLGAVPETYLAGVASAVCFASWIGRPVFDRWATNFTRAMLADTADELTAITREAEALADAQSAAVADEDPPAQRG